ncbi:MAG: hypothetical protein WBL44_07770 [Nitrososphaeraceae archaeon]|jgi:hypothetical protein
MGILNEETSSQPHHQDLVAERSAEIALNTIDILKKELEDQDIRLNEAFAMIDERQNDRKPTPENGRDGTADSIHSL